LRLAQRKNQAYSADSAIKGAGHVDAAIDRCESSRCPPSPDLLVPPRALDAQNAALFAAPAVSGLVTGASVGAALRLSRTALNSTSVSIPLPNSPSAIFTRDRMWTMADGGVRLHGAITIGSDRVDDVYLLARNGSLTGDFTIGQMRYELVQVAPALTRVQTGPAIKSSALKIGPTYNDAIKLPASGPVPAGIENGSSIKLLVAYTAAFTQQNGPIANVRLTNIPWVNDAIRVPVGTTFDDEPGWLLTNEFNESNYGTTSAAGFTLLADFRKAALNVWSEIGRQRNIRKADFAHLAIGYSIVDPNGIAYFTSIPALASEVVAAVSWSERAPTDLQSKYNFAHELGHNMGGDHERAAAVILSPTAYNYEYAYKNVSGTFCRQTMTASPSLCNTHSSDQTYSNPNYLFAGLIPAGIPVGLTDQSDNRTAFQNNRVALANLRGPAVTQDLALGAKIFAAPDFTTHALVRVANHAGNAMAAPKIDFTFPEYAQGPPGPGYFTSISIIQTPAGWTCATRGGAAFAVPTASYECTTSSFAVNGEVEFELAPLALFGGGGGPFTVGAYPRNLDPTVLVNNDDSGFIDNGF
jgi:Metallo-peptidase family M12B Reprolysin-like